MELPVAGRRVPAGDAELSETAGQGVPLRRPDVAALPVRPTAAAVRRLLPVLLRRLARLRLAPPERRMQRRQRTLLRIGLKILSMNQKDGVFL